MFVYNLFNYFRSFRRVTPIFEGALHLLIYRYDLVQVALTLPISLAAFLTRSFRIRIRCTWSCPCQ